MFRPVLALLALACLAGAQSLRQAIVDFQAGRLDKTGQALAAMVREKPDSSEAHFYLGLVYFRSGRLPEAGPLLERAVELSVPGVLRVSVASDDSKVNVSGGLDAGYPLPGKIRQAEFPLPPGTPWEGLKLRAEIEVKGVRYPVRWACHQKTNPDGCLAYTGPSGAVPRRRRDSYRESERNASAALRNSDACSIMRLASSAPRPNSKP
jgi:tetratricopeptide (TPR) repeat protein